MRHKNFYRFSFLAFYSIEQIQKVGGFFHSKKIDEENGPGTGYHSKECENTTNQLQIIRLTSMQNFMVVSLWVEELFKFLSSKLCKKLILPPPLLSFLSIIPDELAALT